jgi:predicted nucleic acid-binding protein
MSGSVFFDTNVLLHLLSDNVEKAQRAEDILAQGGIVSVQVLNEFAAVARRKQRLTWPEIVEVADTISTLCTVESLTLETHVQGRMLAERYGFNVYDAMIVAAAQMADAKVL